MTKKDLEDIIQTAKAAGANVKVVQVGSAENEPVERPMIPLLKLEIRTKHQERWRCAFGIITRGLEHLRKSFLRNGSNQC